MSILGKTIVFKYTNLSIDALYELLTSTAGLVELGVICVCVLIGWRVSRYVFDRWFANAPLRYQQFFPYAGYRLVLPLLAQMLLALAIVLSALVFKHKAHLMQLAFMLLFWLAVIRLVTTMLRQALPKGRVERHTEQFVTTLCWLALVASLTGFDEVIIDTLESIRFHVGKTRIDLWMIFNALLWVSAVLVGALWASRAVEARLMALTELDLNLRLVSAKFARTLLMISAVLIALPVVGIDLTVLSVFGGALGAGLGLGLQKIASNYVSGFIILLDRSIRLGDRLMVDNRVGYVSKITSRYVVLKGLDGSEALVPNDTLIANTVINQSYSDKQIWSSIAVSVAYDTDLPSALRLLAQAGQHPRVANDPAPKGYVTSFGDSAITLELGFWVLDPENGMMSLKSDLLLAVWRLFAEHQIKMPFPQREVRVLNEVERWNTLS